jgi:hypothetical protein
VARAFETFDDLLVNAAAQTNGDTPLFLRHRILTLGCMMVMSVCVDVNLALGYYLS